MADSEDRKARVMKRVFDAARDAGFVEPDPSDSSKEIIRVDREWLIREWKKVDQLEP
jgi:hypothetical protein